jgi:hypothetical protein
LEFSLEARLIDEYSKVNEDWEQFGSISSPDIGRRLDLFMTPGIFLAVAAAPK